MKLKIKLKGLMIILLPFILLFSTNDMNAEDVIPTSPDMITPS